MIEASKETTAVTLKYGMVGGGEGSFIGDVHRKAINLDHKADLVAGCFSRSIDNTRATGASLGVPQDRLYETFEEMAEKESKREDGIDFVSITTPNDSHFAVAKIFLEKGIHVVCDKPLTTTTAQGEELIKLAEKKGLLFAVTYTYSGYPTVKQAKALIKEGKIGEIRFINAEYIQEWLAGDEDNKQAAWRTDPKRAGISCCVGDIGSHIENTVSYMTGLEIESLSARLDKKVPGRLLDDNATIMVNYKGGATGVYWSSQVAIGHDNDLVVRIYGSKGTIEWHQEDANYLTVIYAGEPKQILSRGRDSFYPRPDSLVRLPSGHPEGYFEAFANIYTTFIGAVSKKKTGQALTKDDLDFPGPMEGTQGVTFIEKCVESSEKNSQWVTL
jgi:predicted dehydrogenase